MPRVFFCMVLIFWASQLQAQVLVHEEPRHHPVFQNDKIRVLNVKLPVGDTTQYHIHHTPSLFIYFSSTTTGSQLHGGIAVTRRSKAGALSYENLAAPNLRVHRVWNLDTIPLHVMDIELLGKDSGFSTGSFANPDLYLTIDTSWVRAYRLTVKSNSDFVLREQARSFGVVGVNDANVEFQYTGKSHSHTVTPASFFWINSAEFFKLRNKTDSEAHFILIELPQR